MSRPAGLGALSALLLDGMPAAAQGRTLVVRSGDLEARVQTDPWRMTFADGRRLAARAWRYDAQTRVLRARFAVGRGVLEALRRGQAGCDG